MESTNHEPTPTIRPELEPLPLRMKRLALDERGYPVPWFVDWKDGKPEFRAMDARKWQIAVQTKVCWVCGQPLGGWLAFVIGPMCAITRTTSEPACHLECATWSVKNCPFLSNPDQVRRTADLPEDAQEPAGFGLTRNPGVSCIWVTRTFETFAADSGNKGRLITVGEPQQVSWWKEARPATRAEVHTSIDGGFPALLQMARQEGPSAVAHLDRCVQRLTVFLPPD